jgi:glycosyltransferase involved in cell wall biosynthesis
MVQNASQQRPVPISQKCTPVILFVNWTPTQSSNTTGGGVHVYQNNIATELSLRGYQIHCVNSGWYYDFHKKPYLKTVTSENLIIHNIVNSPIIAPSFLNFATPEAEISNPELESIFSELLQRINPDIVHFNNIEGFTANCIRLAKSFGAKAIYSLHNYHTLCPQVALVHQEKSVCIDFEQGTRCLNCIIPPNRKTTKFLRFAEHKASRIPGGTNVLNLARTTLQRFKRAPYTNASTPSRTKNSQPIGITSKIQASNYANRRKAMLDALNSCDTVLAVSDFVRSLFIEYGVHSDKIITNHIGTLYGEINFWSYPTLETENSNNNSGLTRLVFLGLTSHLKGLGFFLDTLLTLPPNIQKSIELYVYARGLKKEKERLDLAKEVLSKVETRNGYSYKHIPSLLAGKDYGIVPPLWWDNAPQVVMEMLAWRIPIIGSRAGGIPDFVVHEKNGLLFDMGNKEQLRECLIRVVNEPMLQKRLRQNIVPPKSLKMHADELEKIYFT